MGQKYRREAKLGNNITESNHKLQCTYLRAEV
jgi:hypothetical protein